MGASRKLQVEIDCILKKVHEGVEVFDSIWNKFYSTDNANQKEKFEAVLKKEIKKLQRYRDQIKTWIQTNEIKEKKISASYEQALVDARKLVEREMERFKIFQSQRKHKAFCKEGSSQELTTDPKQKAKSETRDWLNNVVEELESQIDNFEAELEGLSVKKGKSKPPRLTYLETSITRHKAHIKKCELLMRLVDNDKLNPEEVNDVKDFLDDYIERNQEAFDEFNDVDELYSSLPLDKVETVEDLVTMTTSLTLQNTLSSSASESASSEASEQEDDTASQDSDLSPGQPLQSNQQIGNVGVIGRKNTDLSPGQPLQYNIQFGTVGVIGRKNSGVRDHIYELQMLEAALSKIPKPEDSERSSSSYTPRNPTITPPSYPQEQAPIVNNPAFWERVGLEPFGNDTLFFAFYHQQNTYQQYLAAKELKKHDWRYHRMYKTWFKRHEAPRLFTNEYEHGTYEYFDYHVPNDGMQDGWCHRIIHDFTFDFKYLEDEFVYE